MSSDASRGDAVRVVLPLPDRDPSWRLAAVDRLRGRPPRELTRERLLFADRLDEAGHVVIDLPAADAIYEAWLRHRDTGEERRLGLAVAGRRPHVFPARELPRVLFLLGAADDDE